MKQLVLVAFVLSACVDSTTDTDVTNLEAAASCGGQLYDACSADDQCDSGLCKLYSNRNVQICTQRCSETEPCPSQDGQPVVCNNMGFCRADAANACEAP
ncbi:MAG: hypothetical protein KIT31_05290 [Deltaproteobacteria bacterium]|nr:hypothetical protein [Deltaproteobacteria bacterium]